MKKFIIATNNAKKLVELDRILNPLGINAVTARDAGVDLGDVEETGTTFEENALIKAMSAFEKSGFPAIADDSGLMVDALDGRPGVYTARYGGEGLSDKERYMNLLDEMKDIPKDKRTARFVSAICCVLSKDEVITVRGECVGEIAFEPSGEGGFGYDPIFLYEGKSFALLTPEEKDSISHRGKALRLLREELLKKNIDG
ncbi:MAG: RdgB/HAM1 family non-canonical purine NTP pyrophosphatase [Anaeromassilibacillus sp.]|nr:RdgB/HAM1 family non-canonical purine NTP pyrophosphatase [Anaeromassilibacillus sp.]MDY3780088.1 RdgB/HAM1 family non-canonical purine NTP pyrophosphatase [Candidatus Limousia pullorum]